MMMIMRRFYISFIMWGLWAALFHDLQFTVWLACFYAVRLICAIADEFLARPPFQVNVWPESDKEHAHIEIQAITRDVARNVANEIARR